MKETLLRKSDELSGACRNYFERLKEWLRQRDDLPSFGEMPQVKGAFGNREISRALRIPIATIKRRHAQLSEIGYLEVEKSNRAKGYSYRITKYAMDENRNSQLENHLEKVLEKVRNAVAVRASGSGGSVVAQHQNEPSKALKDRTKSKVAQ